MVTLRKSGVEADKKALSQSSALFSRISQPLVGARFIGGSRWLLCGADVVDRIRWMLDLQ
jgi:hypothetical protein